MYIRRHHITERGINEPVAFHRRFFAEFGGDDINVEMTFAGAGAGVAGVQVAVVADFQRQRGQRVGKPRLDSFDPGHGRVLRKGLTDTSR